MVKGIHLEGLRVLGPPEYFAKTYYEAGADELIYMDVVASLYGRNSLLEMVRTTAANTFIPLTVGGGLRSVDDIREVLRAGADKVSVNTAAVRNPSLISQASDKFGASTIVLSIEAKATTNGRYEVYTDYGRESTGKDVLEWAIEGVRCGAGEILLTSIDRDGTRKGFDLTLTRMVAEAVSVPVIACGGAGSASDVFEVIDKGFADAVALASLLHYSHLPSASNATRSEGNLEFLRSARRTAPSGETLATLKSALIERGVHVRPAEAGVTR